MGLFTVGDIAGSRISVERTVAAIGMVAGGLATILAAFGVIDLDQSDTVMAEVARLTAENGPLMVLVSVIAFRARGRAAEGNP